MKVTILNKISSSVEVNFPVSNNFENKACYSIGTCKSTTDVIKTKNE